MHICLLGSAIFVPDFINAAGFVLDSVPIFTNSTVFGVILNDTVFSS